MELEATSHKVDPRWMEQSLLVDSVAGLIGGMAGVVTGHPFDTIKVRQQTNPQLCKSLRQCCRTTVVNEGFRGFFKGMAFPLFSMGGLNSVFFSAYSYTLRSLEKKSPSGPQGPSFRNIAIAGALGGMAQAPLATPMELVKVKLQSNIEIAGAKSAGRYTGPWSCMVHVTRNHGLQGNMQGFWLTWLRDGPGFAMYIVSYEYLCNLCKAPGQVQASMYHQFWAGGVAGTLSWWINMPVDILKSKIQADDMSNPKYRGVFHCMRHTFATEGLRAFWRGLPAVSLRAFPMNAITLVVYSQLKVALLDQHYNGLNNLYL